MEFNAELSVAQVALIPMIIGIIQAAKRFKPDAPDNIWFGSSLILGVMLQILAYLALVGSPGSLAAVFNLCVMGVAFGLAAGKTYDQAKVEK